MIKNLVEDGERRWVQKEELRIAHKHLKKHRAGIVSEKTDEMSNMQMVLENLNTILQEKILGGGFDQISDLFLPKIHWECKMVQPHWKTAWQFLLTPNIYRPVTQYFYLVMYLKEKCTYFNIKICTRMFLVVLIIIGKN